MNLTAVILAQSQHDSNLPNEKMLLGIWQGPLAIYVIALVLFTTGSILNDDNDLVEQFILKAVLQPVYSTTTTIDFRLCRKLTVARAFLLQDSTLLATYLLNCIVAPPYITTYQALCAALPRQQLMIYLIIFAHMLLAPPVTFIHRTSSFLIRTYTRCAQTLVQHVKRTSTSFNTSLPSTMDYLISQSSTTIFEAAQILHDQRTLIFNLPTFPDQVIPIPYTSYHARLNDQAVLEALDLFLDSSTIFRELKLHARERIIGLLIHDILNFNDGHSQIYAPNQAFRIAAQTVELQFTRDWFDHYPINDYDRIMAGCEKAGETSAIAVFIFMAVLVLVGFGGLEQVEEGRTLDWSEQVVNDVLEKSKTVRHGLEMVKGTNDKMTPKRKWRDSLDSGYGSSSKLKLD